MKHILTTYDFKVKLPTRIVYDVDIVDYIEVVTTHIDKEGNVATFDTEPIESIKDFKEKQELAIFKENGDVFVLYYRGTPEKDWILRKSNNYPPSRKQDETLRSPKELKT